MLSGFKSNAERILFKYYENNPEWYFKTEDEYDFLALAG